MNLQLNEYAIPGNKYIDIGWAKYWVLYRVQAEMVSKPIHLFLKLKSFFSVTAGATCSNKDFAASGRDLHFAWVAWLCPLLKCRPRPKQTDFKKNPIPNEVQSSKA